MAASGLSRSFVETSTAALKPSCFYLIVYVLHIYILCIIYTFTQFTLLDHKSIEEKQPFYSYLHISKVRQRL